MSIDTRKEVIGTQGADELSGSYTHNYYFGLQGDDNITSAVLRGNYVNDLMYMAGGTGSDSYHQSGFSSFIIVETGGDNDSYYHESNLKFNFSNAVQYFGEVDNKHIGMIDSSNSLFVYANYNNPSSKVENFYFDIDLTGTVKHYTHDQFISAVKSSKNWLGSISYDQLNVTDSDQTEFEEALAAVTRLSNEYEASSGSNTDPDRSDTKNYSGVFQDYSIKKSDSGYDIFNNNKIVGSVDGSSKISFDDYSVSFDSEGVSGQAYRLYKAAFDREPDKAGLGFWIDGLNGGASMDAVANGFISSNEFKGLYGENATNEVFLTALYNNVLDRSPDGSGFEWWLDALNSGNSMKSDVLIGFSESAENQANTIDLIANGVVYEEWLG